MRVRSCVSCVPCLFLAASFTACTGPEPLAPSDGATPAATRPVVVILESRDERVEITADLMHGPGSERLHRMTAPMTVMADLDTTLLLPR
jgi:hypothetical protein